jgi:hypothetical protein
VVVGIDSIQHYMMSIGIDWSDAKLKLHGLCVNCEPFSCIMEWAQKNACYLLVWTFLFYLHVRLAEEWWPKKFNVDMVFLQDIGIFQKIADTDTELVCSLSVFREQLSTMYLTLL